MADRTGRAHRAEGAGAEGAGAEGRQPATTGAAAGRSTARSTCTGLRAIALGLALGVCVTGPGMAWAQESWGSGNLTGHDYVNTGGYVVIGGLTGFETFRRDGGQDFDSSFGFVVKGGARLHPYFAAEVEGNFLSGFDTVVDLRDNPDVPAGFPPFAGLTVDGGNVTVNAKAYLPLGRLQPYALVGLGGMWARLRSTNPVTVVCGPSFYFYWYCTGAYAQLASTGGFVMRYGGGFDLHLGRDWALVIDASFVQPFGDIEELSYVNLNWGVRFDF